MARRKVKLRKHHKCHKGHKNKSGLRRKRRKKSTIRVGRGFIGKNGKRKTYKLRF